ncbi:MAG: hypothetical protein P4M00_25570 [Azospirillaceae bacterium]|nr:hypothetical protein [Azospirillaceae bacterium]
MVRRSSERLHTRPAREPLPQAQSPSETGTGPLIAATPSSAMVPTTVGASGDLPRTVPVRSEPAAPIDAVEARLRDTARSCLVGYRGWRQQPGENSIQALQEAMHDLRKALARIEIDISMALRNEHVARPIPIPTHRAARRPNR